MTGRRDRRRAAFRLGLRAEWVAAQWLRLKGFRILDQRFRTGRGEIDLVARRGATVAFVEVKARSSRGKALESVGPQTRRRIIDAANIWISRNPNYTNYVFRFDIMIIVPFRLPEHLQNAFEGR